MGITGIETGEIARALVRQLQPAAVLAIDALCASDPAHLCASFQFSDTGIAPGSGAGNHRQALTRETLGVPVIAAGVPTVIASLSVLEWFSIAEHITKQFTSLIFCAISSAVSLPV